MTDCGGDEANHADAVGDHFYLLASGLLHSMPASYGRLALLSLRLKDTNNLCPTKDAQPVVRTTCTPQARKSDTEH